MNHYFDIEQAEKYGIPAAILLTNFAHWIVKNRSNDKHYLEGRTWTYNSVSAFKELFPYMGIKQIRAALDKLVTEGVLLKRDWNEGKADRTLWYAFRDEEAFIGPIGHLPKKANGVPKRGEACAEKGKCTKEPNINTDINTDKSIGKRASRLSPDWMPSASDASFLQTKRPDLNLVDVADNFRDYWIAQPNGIKLDWSATWRTWVRRQTQQASRAPIPAKPSRHSGFNQLDYSEGTSDGRIN